MDMSMFTSFEGRINRAKWWLGTVIMIVVAIIVGLIIGSVTGVSMMGGMMGTADATSLGRSMAVSQLITLVIIAYPVTALMVQRLNDRDRPRWLAAVFWAPTVLSILAGLAGLTMTTTDVGGVAMPSQSGLGMILGLLSLAIGIWALIELGILKGTTGPNQHGPDPLAR